MKLHDLRPADGSRQPRTRVGRGIAAGKGKTAGRGTKGQKARAGGSIQPWFEGGQTPLHMRIPKLHGFKNRFKIEYEVVNIGAIGALAEGGAFEFEDAGKKGAKSAPITVNQDILRAVGLVRTLNKPMKILGAGELTVPLFVVADAFTASARAKIEAAGGSVNVLEVPTSPLAALGIGPDAKGGKSGIAAAAEAPAAKAPVAAEAVEAPAKASSKPASKAASKDAVKPSAKAAEKAPAPKAPSAKASSAKAPATKASAAKASAAKRAPADEAEVTAPGKTDADEPTSVAEAGTPSGDDA
jgi:large subunit ribosomal protein L15